ncbi:YpdA family putative bacillithiol disulfide reductase [Gemmatimonas sp.]|jgi:thioredoxin reductase (NADPH)|uniref:YpdA family putative bacillithiol disulfide reductase n=1 Tax=Gemmatimonas sp. TaxID=1962908 RepID=UPI0022BB4256|nr:YpdA family putative bacillithiol disulfide reductase [Gemmatimonas sp.]MCA2982562.1 YpdA family putative bacillithiol disulfide reductase [Gemmatimonas sp.]MCA2989140.1 YpdA family putative bacillithiol disulfide reductase [Gemmatimonas sp.]MCA2992575.1 YpdA family putative bacillithiol disulfide reductase [Gemmatimonas sp.]MCA2993446.1 YpdA family putative bacillithiol disulfide reductase [Gemmatimonas sp.]MCE2954869.1 YpdA family putative bacillithiol disulfide reductase [Gemmatimonas sp
MTVETMTVDVAVVGAGPCGLAAAIAAQRAGLSAVVFDRGCLVNGIASYPTYMSFFSTAERLAIGGVPFIVATEKPTRRDALAYYRGVADVYGIEVRQYEGVQLLRPVRVDPRPGQAEPTRAARWLLQSKRRSGAVRETAAHAVVIATGYFGRPMLLGVPGEGLPHVRHGYTEGHGAWREPVVIVGGANSAVDAALDMHRAGAHVTLVHFGAMLDANVKPWVRPEIEARLREGSIASRFGARVVAIEADAVVVEGAAGIERLPATQVYTMTGYLPETGLLEQVGVPLDADSGIPAHDPLTMATPLPGVYLAGVIASGNQANRIFIENGRDHGDAIVAHLLRHSLR